MNNRRIFIPLLTAVLLLALSACSGAQTGRSLTPAEQPLAPAVEAPNPVIQTVNPPASTETTPQTLTKEQAQTIALEHAGFTADQVRGLRTEYEIDDGIPRYEIQFRQGRWEYDYEINAETGAILSYDRDD